jgi:transcriptional regulator with XRE-family HTH domain
MASKTESPIRAARKRLGLSRDELGRILNVSGRTVSYWETRRKLPDPRRAAALRHRLQLSELDLWRALHKPAPKVGATKRQRPW